MKEQGTVMERSSYLCRDLPIRPSRVLRHSMGLDPRVERHWPAKIERISKQMQAGGGELSSTDRDVPGGALVPAGHAYSRCVLGLVFFFSKF